MLNALELLETTEPDTQGRIAITLEVAEESIRARSYTIKGIISDTISAFIKSMRSSIPMQLLLACA